LDPRPTEGLSRKEILRKSSDFRRVFRLGERRRTKHFNLYLARTDGSARLGLTVSRKIGNAVVRNSVKRKIREYFRKNKILISQRDLVVVARPGSGMLNSRAIHQEIQRALEIDLQMAGSKTRRVKNGK
jgi:ribonuclease P protein component